MSESALKARIKELEETIKNLEQNLIHDPLTGLKTRTYFDEEAKVFFDIAVNSGSGFMTRRRKWFGFSEISFLFIDIDHFKKVNDMHGHLAGDTVLKAVAETVKTSVREGDIASRWGGEEFAVALVGATERDAWSKAEEIRRHIEGIRFGAHPDISVTVSIGVSSAEQGLTFEQAIDRADKALYTAKRERNKVLAYSEL